MLDVFELLYAPFQTVTPSITLKLNAASRHRKEVLKLATYNHTVGAPHLKTEKAAIDLLVPDLYLPTAFSYGAGEGDADLRKIIAEALKGRLHREVNFKHVVTTPGTKTALTWTIMAFAGGGGVFYLPTPNWTSHGATAALLGANVRKLRTGPETGWKITARQLKAVLSSSNPGERALLLLNSPSNPTGAVYTREELLEIAEVLREYPNVMILEDGIYSGLVYFGGVYVSLMEVAPDLAARIIWVSGTAKEFGQPSARIGFMYVPSEELNPRNNLTLAEHFGAIQGHLTGSAAGPMQRLSVYSFELGDTYPAKLRIAYEANINALRERHSEFDGLLDLPSVPQAGLFAYYRMGERLVELYNGADEVCRRLIEVCGVVAIPCEEFNDPLGIRFSFAVGPEDFLAGFNSFISGIKALAQ